MAEKQISILLVAKNMASKTIGQVNKDLGKLGGAGRRAGQGLRTLGANLAKIGAVAAVGIGVAVKNGIDSLVELESAVTSVNGAIKTMGLTGKVSGAQVAGWANEIEASTQSAFDDKAITAASANLIRYGKVGAANLRPAMVVMTDLAAKNGDVEATSKAMGKALADPTKATRLLKDAGVTLTKAQQKQITSLVKAGKLQEAQAILLREVGKSTQGAASAMNGPMKDAQETLKDVVENSQRALAEGFLPVLERVSKSLSKALGDPATLGAIRSFGKGLAGAFDNLVSFAEKIDWGRIGSGLKIAAEWGGKLVGAISKMPPEALAAIVALGGLNKLTGGAIGSIVGELGKGLIKGVLGITAGVVNVNGAVVNGGGTPPIPGKGGGGGLLGKVGAAGALTTAGIVGIASGAVAATMLGILYGGNALVGAPKNGNERTPMKGKLGPSNGLTTPIFEAQMGALIGNINGGTTRTLETLRANQAKDQGQAAQMLASMSGLKSTEAQSLVAFRAAERAFASAPAPKVDVSTVVKVNVTAASVTRSVAVRARIGPTGGSRSSPGHPGGGGV